MKKLIIALVLPTLLAACTDENTARRALDGAGYTQVQITGWRLTGCSDSDNFVTGFKAVGPTGKPVSGVVCSGWWKGATIRTD